MQEERLQFLAQHELPYHPFFSQILSSYGLRSSDFLHLSDLHKLPLISKEDIAPRPEDPTRPRQFILQPNEQLIRKHAPKSLIAKLLWQRAIGNDPKRLLEWIYKPVHTHFTTGRSAVSTPVVYSARDIQMLRETGARLFSISGASHDDRAVNVFPYAPHLAFWLAYHALSEMGITSVHTGGGKTMGTEKIIQLIERFKPQILIFIPGYAYHLLRVAALQGRDFSSVKMIILGGERVSPGLREKIRELLVSMGASDVKILATYAFTEAKTAWIQCDERSGYHLSPDVEHIELVDERGNPVPEDTPGEIVYSSLDWRGSMFLRYRTGDMARGINWGPCPYCGRNLPRLHFDIQRKSEHKEFRLTNLKGTLVNLNAFFPMLSGMKQIEEWQVILRKKSEDLFGLDELVIHVAPKSGIAFEDIKRDIQQAVMNEMELVPVIELVSLGTLLEDLGMESELKERRIVDTRGSA